MPDIFLSYARANQERVRKIADELEAEGYVVWWDAELPAHRAYGDVIQEQIANAKAVVVAWSADARASEWVRAEADMARIAKKLVQLSLDDTPLPIPFDQIHVAKLGGWQGNRNDPEWLTITRSIASLVEGSGAVGAGDKPATGMRRKRRQRILTNTLWALTGCLLTVLAEAGVWATNGMQPLWPGAGAKNTVKFILPNSDHLPLTKPELAGLTNRQLRIARNEIFARHSRRFMSPDLRRYFCQLDWYTPLYPDVTISQLEQNNVDAICDEEKSRHLDTCPLK